MRVIATAAITACILCAAGPVAAQADLTEAIDQAVERGIEWTWSRLKPNGMFSGHNPRKRTEDYYYYGDWEVVCMTSLAYAGVRPEDPRIKPALKTLLELKLDRTYTIGFRMIALAEFYRNAKDATRPGLRAALKRDVDALVSYQHGDGSWHYHGKSRSQWDFSNTQIALLALKEAVACGVEVDRAVFQKALKLYLEKQRPDGGWNYGNPTKPAGTGPSYVSMTAAGTASLFILRDLLNPGQGCPCRGGRSAGRRDARVDQAIDRALAWLAEHLPADGRAVTKNKCNYYQLYAGERVGINSGLKYLGTHDWYAEGVRQILPLQKPDGVWPGKCGDAMFALLFLIKGRGPILMNKLLYDGTWDLHPRDAANLAGYVGQIKEQRINWQVIHLDIPVEAMHDSPILYVTAERAAKFSDEHKRKLREFTDTGGTILLEASCGSRAATAWWPCLCRELWPEWELKTITREHPLWQADLKMTKLVPGLMGISDGLRTFLFYSPRDISCKWHAQSITRNEELFKFGGNLYAYATDRGRLRGRLAAREVGAGTKYATDKLVLAGGGRTLKVARFAHGGRWHLGRHYRPWERLAADLKERTGLDLSEGDPVEPGKDIPADVGLVYLTGREALGLDDAARARLKAYLASGGFLFAEATLGDEAFDKTCRETLSAMRLTLKAAGPDDPLLTGAMPGGGTGYKVCDADYTFALRPSRVGKTQPLLFRIESGDRLVGVYSPFDIMYSQTGCTAFDSRGYAAADARALASNVVLLAAGRPKVVAPER